LTSPQLFENSGIFTPQIEGIDPDTILRIHGYKTPDKVKTVIREMARKMLDEGMSIFEPLIYYRKIKIQSVEGAFLRLETGQTCLENPEFEITLSECTHIVVFLLTLGQGPDQKSVALLQNDDLLEAVFLETASWLAIERATRFFTQQLRSILSNHNCRITRRLAPGYKEWPLTDQKKIFKLFEEQDMVIRLLDGDCMQPKMSRSGLFGIAPERACKAEPN